MSRNDWLTLSRRLSVVVLTLATIWIAIAMLKGDTP